MDSQDIPRYGEKGQLYCRRAVWVDAAKFFLLNIVLHATTVMSTPGSSLLETTLRTTMSILAPFSGLAWAIQTIVRSTRMLKNEVEEAHRAGALCMLVLSTYWPGFEFRGELHGQFPNRKRSLLTRLISGGSSEEDSRDLDRELIQLSVECKPITVPYYFTVRPTRDREYGEIMLARNYNIVKGLAAILQICYGSFELYDSRKIQFKKYGYGAYSIIVIPYVLMSLVNLIASLCQPEYPSKYLVLYGGKEEGDGMVIGSSIQENSPNDSWVARRPVPVSEEVNRDWIMSVQKNTSGVVGYAYGILKPTLVELRATRQWKAIGLKNGITVLICIVTLPIPYLIIYSLTGFEEGQSTPWERMWVMLSIVLGQAGWIILWLLNSFLIRLIPKARDPAKSLPGGGLVGLRAATGKAYPLSVLIYGLVLGGAIIFSFIVVGRMILDDDICTRL